TEHPGCHRRGALLTPPFAPRRRSRRPPRPRLPGEPFGGGGEDIVLLPVGRRRQVIDSTTATLRRGTGAPLNETALARRGTDDDRWRADDLALQSPGEPPRPVRGSKRIPLRETGTLGT